MTRNGLEPGRRLPPDYIIDRPLGSGGMGDVYLAWDERLGRPVAIKVLRADRTADATAVERFRREAQSLSSVFHPNVVVVHGLGRVDGTLYLAMEYVAGESLRRALDERGPWAVRAVCGVIGQVASGLAEVHAAKILHRDVTPGNILLRPLASGSLLVKVVDFGLARSLTNEDTSLTGALVIGTAPYLAPEQISQGRLDARTDLWALATVAFEMLTGAPPFFRDSVGGIFDAIRNDEVPSLAAVPGVSPAIEFELRRALSKNAAERHPDVMSFARDLMKAAGLEAGDGSGESCFVCEAEVRSAARFCGACGTALPLTRCAACASQNATGRGTCTVCATTLLMSVGAPGGERVPAVVVVARFEVAPLAETLGAFGALIEREGGHPVALLGSEAVAVFGIGGRGERDADRAVDAALAFQAEAARQHCSVAVGVEAGPVGTRGFGVYRGVAELTGEVVGHARACADSYGSIRLGERAMRVVRSQYDHDPSTSAVIRRKPVEALYRMAARADIPVVGRDLDVQHFVRAGRRVASMKELRLAVVSGAPGVGKSRLVAEAASRLQADAPWRVVAGRCSPAATSSAYEPFGTMVQSMLHADGATDLLERGLLEIFAPEEDAQAQAHALVRLLGFSRSGPSLPAPEEDRRRAFDAFGRYWRRATERPVMLVLEDAQWMPAAAQRLLTHVLEQCLDRPLFVVVVVRHDRRDALLQKVEVQPGRLVPVELDPLEDADSRALVAAILGATAPDELVELVGAVARGIPLHVEELLEALKESGAVRISDGRCELDASWLSVASWTGSAAAVIATRIERIGPEAASVLQALAVAGHPVPRPLVDAMVGGYAADIDALIDAGLVVELRELGSSHFALRQPLIRDLVLRAAPDLTRKRMHERAALWMSEAEGAGEFGRALADHLMSAGEHRRAAGHMLDAARDAMHAFDNAGAYELLGRASAIAAEWVVESPGDATARSLQVDAAVLLAEVAACVGEFDEALRSAGIVRETSDDPRQRVRALCLRGEALESLGRNEEAAAVFRDAADEATGDPQSLYATGRLAMTLFKRKQYAEAETVALRAIEEARGLPQSLMLDRALGSLHGVRGHVFSSREELHKARDHYALAQEHLARSGDPVAAAMMLVSIGNMAFRDDQMKRAGESYEAALAECNRTGARMGAAVARTNLGHVFLRTGKAERAVEMLTSASLTLRSIGVRDRLAHALWLLGEGKRLTGLITEATTAANEALQIATELGQPDDELEAREVLRRIALQTAPTRVQVTEAQQEGSDDDDEQ